MNAIADVHFLQQPQSTQLEPRFDEEYGVYWALMNPRFGTFNPQFLGEDVRPVMKEASDFTPEGWAWLKKFMKAKLNVNL